MLFIDADASVVIAWRHQASLKNMFVSDFSAFQLNSSLIWRDGMYFIVKFYIVKLLPNTRTLENNRIKLSN